MPGAEQAEADAEVYGQAIVHPPVILRKRLGDKVSVVVIALAAILLEIADPVVRVSGKVADEKIGERIADTIETAHIAETKNALDVAGIRPNCLIQFVPLGIDHLNSDLQRMFAQHFAEIVAHGIGWIGMVPGKITGVD